MLVRCRTGCRRVGLPRGAPKGSEPVVSEELARSDSAGGELVGSVELLVGDGDPGDSAARGAVDEQRGARHVLAERAAHLRPARPPRLGAPWVHGRLAVDLRAEFPDRKGFSQQPALDAGRCAGVVRRVSICPTAGWTLAVAPSGHAPGSDRRRDEGVLRARAGRLKPGVLEHHIRTGLHRQGRSGAVDLASTIPSARELAVDATSCSSRWPAGPSRRTSARWRST